MGAVRKQTQVSRSKKSLKAGRKARGKAAERRGVVLLKSPRKKAKALTDLEREEMVIEHREQAQKLARSILRKWNSRIEIDELESCVDLSLCEAIRKFDPNKGASFITFLFYHLRGNLIRTVSGLATLNLIPVDESELEEGIERRGTAFRGMTAMDAAEAVCAYDSAQPDELLYKKQLVTFSRDGLARLDALEREVLERIYCEGEALMSVAHSLGYSRCHISRVKKRALETLSQFMEVSLDGASKDASEIEIEQQKSSIVERRRIHRRRPRSGEANDCDVLLAEVA